MELKPKGVLTPSKQTSGVDVTHTPPTTGPASLKCAATRAVQSRVPRQFICEADNGVRGLVLSITHST